MTAARQVVLEGLLAAAPVGRVDWLGVRPAKRQAIRVVDAVDVLADLGFDGDRAVRKPSRRRQVTLLQAEHLAVVAQLLGRDAPIDPAWLRRNAVVSGLALAALKGRRFRLGAALLEGTGDCDPCPRMEEALGRGGFVAMAGHGGITARVLEGGRVQVGDAIAIVTEGA